MKSVFDLLGSGALQLQIHYLKALCVRGTSWEFHVHGRVQIYGNWERATAARCSSIVMYRYSEYNENNIEFRLQRRSFVLFSYT